MAPHTRTITQAPVNVSPLGPSTEAVPSSTAVATTADSLGGDSGARSWVTPNATTSRARPDINSERLKVARPVTGEHRLPAWHHCKLRPTVVHGPRLCRVERRSAARGSRPLTSHPIAPARYHVDHDLALQRQPANDASLVLRCCDGCSVRDLRSASCRRRSALWPGPFDDVSGLCGSVGPCLDRSDRASEQQRARRRATVQ